MLMMKGCLFCSSCGGKKGWYAATTAAARNASSSARAPPAPLLVQRTSSPWVWASSEVAAEELRHALPAPGSRGLRLGEAFFAAHGPRARFVPPKDFEYELPTGGVPEIAFAGRSNVGKSSLLAALLQGRQPQQQQQQQQQPGKGLKKGGSKRKLKGGGSGGQLLVRTSKTPGCTSSVNYFELGVGTGRSSSGGSSSKGLYLVDLPGYGFSARGSKEDQKRWGAVMDAYLTGRGFTTLRRVLVLVDARRGPLPDDWRLMERLSGARVPFQLVLTKADAVPQATRSSGGGSGGGEGGCGDQGKGGESGEDGAKDSPPPPPPLEHEQQPAENLVLRARAMQLFDELRQWHDVTPSNLPLVHAVSAKTGGGLRELQFTIAAAAQLI
jgi:GTP-binding protein